MSAGLGTCHCGKVANARLGCPCGWSYRYCAACFQTSVAAAAAHCDTCETMRRAVGEPPRQLSLGVPLVRP
jgi:hypothetical protein